VRANKERIEVSEGEKNKKLRKREEEKRSTGWYSNPEFRC
jgi:hypothetical protein